MMETTPDIDENKNYGQEYLDRLKLACENFLRKEEFEVGQIVKWKTDLKNRKLPRRNQPAIVVAILDEPTVSIYRLSAVSSRRIPPLIAPGVR